MSLLAAKGSPAKTWRLILGDLPKKKTPRTRSASRRIQRKAITAGPRPLIFTGWPLPKGFFAGPKGFGQAFLMRAAALGGEAAA
jgi:hypothetical protein